MSDDKDPRPEVAKKDDPQPRKDVKEHWAAAEETMNENAAGSPNAEKRSRTA